MKYIFKFLTFTFLSLVFFINLSFAKKVCAYKEYVYYVKPGDSIWKIAKKFKTSAKAIKKWNKLRSYRLKPGQKLIIYKKICWEAFDPYKNKDNNKIDLNLLVRLSERGKLKPTYKKEKICNQKTYVHIVKRGESLWKIAKKYGVSVSSIKRENNLRSNILKVGQKLIIKKQICKIIVKKPEIKSASKKRKFIILYKVKKGDSLWKIAKKFNVKVSTIKKLNNLKSNYLKVGQVLKIPTYKVNRLGELVINRPLNFIWPVDGCIDTTPKKSGFNNSVIFRAPKGTPVKAVEIGKVLFAGPNNKFAKSLNNIVIIKHPKGFVSVYAMLSKVAVKKGDIVEKGDVIGYAGSSPLFKTSGVFFYILKKKKRRYYSLDPLKVLK